MLSWEQDHGRLLFDNPNSIASMDAGILPPETEDSIMAKHGNRSNNEAVEPVATPKWTGDESGRLFCDGQEVLSSSGQLIIRFPREKGYPTDGTVKFLEALRKKHGGTDLVIHVKGHLASVAELDFPANGKSRTKKVHQSKNYDA